MGEAVHVAFTRVVESRRRQSDDAAVRRSGGEPFGSAAFHDGIIPAVQSHARVLHLVAGRVHECVGVEHLPVVWGENEGDHRYANGRGSREDCDRAAGAEVLDEEGRGRVAAGDVRHDVGARQLAPTEPMVDACSGGVPRTEEERLSAVLAEVGDRLTAQPGRNPLPSMFGSGGNLAKSGQGWDSKRRSRATRARHLVSTPGQVNHCAVVGGLTPKEDLDGNVLLSGEDPLPELEQLLSQVSIQGRLVLRHWYSGHIVLTQRFHSHPSQPRRVGGMLIETLPDTSGEG